MSGIVLSLFPIFRRSWGTGLIAALAVTLLLTPARAQVGSGSITGVVRDSTQAPIPGAAIKIINAQSGVITNVVTNETGGYRVNSILPGTYRIEASAPGFDTVVQKDFALSTGQTLAVDLTLQVGEQHQTVTIEANGPLSDTQSSSLAQVVGHEYIENLPLPNC